MSEPSTSLRALLSLAWPVVLARATQSVIGFSDALLVSPLGEEPLAAVTTGSLNTIAFIIFPMGVAFIVQSFAAQLRGRGEHAAITRYGFYGLSLSLFAGLVALACIPFLPSLLGSLGYAPRVTALMTDYLQIRLLSVAPAVGIEALGNWYGGLGRTRPGMVAGIIAMVANVLGCYALVMPRFGLPGFGVAGSAWASTVATYLGFLVILTMFLRERTDGRSPMSMLGDLSMREFKRVLRFGFPNGVAWFLEFGAFAFFINLVVGHLGTTALAAFNVVMQLNSISFMPAFGLASSGAIMVGETIGRRAHERVWPIVRMTLTVNCLWMGSVGVSYLFFADELMEVFRPEGMQTMELIRIGSHILAWSAVWQLFDGISLTFSESLRAAGDTAFSMAARLVLAWLVFTPFGWISVRWYGGGVRAVLGAMVLYLLTLAIALSLRFASGKWKSIDLVGEPQVV
jgi:multidrug resistance protein, MATE family